MRDRLAAIIVALQAIWAGTGLKFSESQDMSELVIKGIRLSLAGPQALPLPVVQRGNPSYDGSRAFFTVSLTNESGNRRTLPFDELRRNVALVYRNQASEETVDDRTPPPKRDGSVERFAPGQTRTFQVVFEYPSKIARFQQGVAVLQFCVRWRSDRLRAAYYTAGSYDWNESFELCREIRIVEG